MDCVLNLINELDKPALLITALFLFIYLISKNKLTFVVIAQYLILSNWFLYIPDSMSTAMVYDCFTIISSGFLMYIFRKNFILLLSESLFFIFNITSYAVSALYYKYEIEFLYNLSMSVYNFYTYVFLINLILFTIGCFYKGNKNGGRRVNSGDNAIRDDQYIHDVYSSGLMAYYERRY